MPAHIPANSLTDILFEQANHFVGLYDVAQGWFTQVNPAGYQLLGYPSAQAFYHDPVRALRSRQLPPEEWARLCEEVLQTGRQEVEAELSRLSGSSFWARLELHSFTHEGKPHLVVRITDTDHLRATERRLSQSVGRFEAVFAHATIGIIVCNRQGDIVLANEKAQELFDYPTGALLGQRIDLLVPDAMSHRHERLRESFNANPQVRAMGHNRDLQARRRDGSVFPVEVSLSYFHLEDELFVVSYVIDITFKKEAERELIDQRQRVERLNAELEQKVTDRTHALMTTLAQLEKRTEELGQALRAEQELGELKSRFVSMASHEFRTPLTAVLTSTALIEKYPGTDQQDKRVKHLQRIRASVNHLNDILEEFLSVGRIEEGRIEARPVELNLGQLLHETIADVQGLRKAGQTIVPELNCPAPVYLDPSLLRKILVNLLSNALKYSGEGSLVRVRAQCQGSQVLIQVQDQGVGISPEDQQHLFERFFRARNVANVPGTGLGLYIIAKYLELMNGTISLQSEVGVGTTVTITIPL
ncbi:PAS domain-containing sensor histidine kinase [Hymenobacter sediminis]|uniref:sensor histidine kinase n=1 Tax=Hymenobacter sediminis TaxID=2218621 RepID=UPI000DA68AEF|nr:PAS domain-containing sensor histidine kinase [Hymenobacter sediminis]RPD48325.1 PAS domain-containing sensor histidine kinase [Hymenobacter sediminis]